MSTTLLGKIQYTQVSTFIIMMIASAFNYSDISEAAQKTSEHTNAPDIEMIFSGVGSGETPPFTVGDGWKIQWEAESPQFKLSAHGTAQRPYQAQTNEREEILRRFEAVRPIVLANTTDKDGTVFHPFGGTYYLKIVSDGPWHIHLQTVPDTKDYLDVPYTGAP